MSLYIILSLFMFSENLNFFIFFKGFIGKVNANVFALSSCATKIRFLDFQFVVLKKLQLDMRSHYQEARKYCRRMN
jgi:hypothetical protein